MKRFELSTLSLARRCSTTELHPQVDTRVVTLATWEACITEVPWVKRVDKGRHINQRAEALASQEFKYRDHQSFPHQLREKPLLKHC